MRHARVVLVVLLVSAAALADWQASREAFASAYASTEPADRVRAVKGLKDFDHPEGMALLLECYRGEPDSDVRHALADAMNAIVAVKARDVFRDTILKHPDPAVRARFCALFADGRMLDRFEMMRQLLRDPEAVVRARALRNLGPEDGSLAEDAVKRLTDAEMDVRMAAAGALGAIRSTVACGPLIAALREEKNAEVSWALGDALDRISGQHYGTDVNAWAGWWKEERLKKMSPVDLAIEKGAEFLKANMPAPLPMEFRGASNGAELSAYALIHAGVPADDPVLKAAIEVMATAPLTSTYTVSVTALALADLDPKKYGDRLAEIAQWLTDAQCENGQWTYWLERPNVTTTPQARPPKPVKTGGKEGGTAATRPIKWKALRREPSGDNSNTQFALLGLRATLAAGCDVPSQAWERSLAWWTRSQGGDGGWSYGPGMTNSYGSMTVSGLSSVAICLHALGKEDQLQPEKKKLVPSVARGLEWLRKHWSVKDNPTQGAMWHYYYLYGLERAGMILGMEELAGHKWYEEGSTLLLAAQKEDGSWISSSAQYDTAFAILFLRRATRGYTQSGQGK